MRLQDYLTETGTSCADFSEKLDVSYETVRRYLSGERIPDRQRMALIALATNGQVTANDFFNLTLPGEAA